MADLTVRLFVGIDNDGVELVYQASIVCILVAFADLDGNDWLDELAANMAFFIQIVAVSFRVDG